MISTKKPLTLLGIKLVVHIKPEVRESWTPRATPAYYIGLALRHYRCYRIWITETNAERISDTIAWFLYYTNLEIHTNHTTLLSTAHELTYTLLQPILSSSSPHYLTTISNHYWNWRKFSKIPSLLMPLLPVLMVITLLMRMM